MGKTVAVISEYNPFHKGHLFHINSIRRDFGDDTTIVAIMSGNYTQRGEIAFADKLLRARAAVDCGVNLVLELPFPYSSASAEFFARAGVSIANSIGVVDAISFGSECGDVGIIGEIAKNMTSEKFELALKESIKNEAASTGYPELVESVYRDCFGLSSERMTTPNNVLAIEYVKALIKAKSDIIPHTIKREGLNYNSNELSKELLPSASAIRVALEQGDRSAFDFVPDSSKNALFDAFQKEFPCDSEKLSSAIISYFRLNPTPAMAFHDAEGGLYNRLAKISRKTDSITSLTELAATKKYTTARIRRAILFSFIGVTSSDVSSEPRYTQVLAMDDFGAKVLRSAKKSSSINIITKPSSLKGLDEVALRQKQLSDAADSVFHLTKPYTVDGDSHLRFSPYVKK